jgi:hypothetical protein
MRTPTRFCLLCCLLFVSAHRLPAPIVEEEKPTSAPAQSPKPKPKPKQDTGERTAKQRAEAKTKQSPFAPFAGVWSGPVTGSFNSDVGLNIPATKNVTTFRISNDGTINSGQNVFRGVLSHDGRALTWTYQYSDANGSGRGTGSLRLVAMNTATYETDVFITTNSNGNIKMRSSGTLTKQ